MEGSGSIGLLSESRIPESRGPKVSGYFGEESVVWFGWFFGGGGFFPKPKVSSSLLFLETHSPSQH